MKACRIHRFGSPEVIVIEDVARPEPRRRELLVRVGAAGVGAWDSWVRAGKSVLDQPLPLTLGADLCGVVEEIGDDVTEFAPGQRVYGATNARFTGAHAELAIVDAGRVAIAPTRLTATEAASVPIVAVTALQMLFEHGQLRTGQRVLIHGASGNVGGYAVQLAHAAGATVIATAIGPGVRVAQTLKADQVLDLRTAQLEDCVPAVELIIDTVGGELQRRSLGLLARGGRLISSVNPPDAELAARAGASAAFMLVDVTTAALAQLAKLLDDGSLIPRVGAVLPLAQAREAHEMLEGSRSRPPGRIVLTAA